MITRGGCMDENFFLLCVRDENRTRFRFYGINYAAWYMVAIWEEEYRIYRHVIMALLGYEILSLNHKVLFITHQVIILKFLQQVNLRYFAYRINSLCIINPISKDSLLKNVFSFHNNVIYGFNGLWISSIFFQWGKVG